MRAYRALLHLYPSSFRAEYAAELCAIFARARRAASGPAVAALWLGAVADVVANAAAAHADILRQDLRYTARTLARARGFTLTAILIVGLGIGATTAAFSVTDFVLVRPLPFPDADRLVKVWQKQPGYARMELSPANYRDWTQAATSFEGIGAYTDLPVNFVGQGEPQRIDGAMVSASLMPTLGVQPMLGRVFREDEDRAGAPGRLILSYRFWQASFAGDPNVLGRRVLLDDEPHEVVGVMPRSFQFPNRKVEFWRPLRLGPQFYEDRNDNWLLSIGRLKPGMSLEGVRAEMDVVAAQVAARFPRGSDRIAASVFRVRDELSPQSRLLIWALGIAAGCVLLIACANLANLLLARALGRRQEIAVRTALGAGRERLARQLATEGMTLAALGGILGVGMAAVVVPLLSQLVPMTLPMPDVPGIDLRVLGFATVATAITGVVFGLAPMLRTGSDRHLGGLRDGLRAGGGAKDRLRSALVVAEVIASVVLLVAAGLLLRALWTVQSTDPGFRADNVLTMRTALPWPRYAATATRQAFFTSVLDDVKALPGVAGAAYITYLPMTMRGGIWPVGLQGEVLERTSGHTASLRFVTPGFFAALGIPIHAGRDVSGSDQGNSEQVAVVSASFVERYWPGGSAIGRRFQFAFQERTIVGVVGNVRVRGLERESEPQVYLPSTQVADGFFVGYTPKDLVVKASGSPAALVPAVRAIVRKADPQQPISDVRLLSDVVELDTASRSVQVRVLAAFAAIAFTLAAIGIHGVLAFAVSQRTTEIGVRVALGAQRKDVLGMVLGQGVLLAAAGLAPGLLLAYFTGRQLESLLAGVKPWDLATYGGAATLCLLMTIAGSLVPALRAVRIDPVKAIRAE